MTIEEVGNAVMKAAKKSITKTTNVINAHHKTFMRIVRKSNKERIDFKPLSFVTDGITFYVRMDKEGDKCVITLADTGNDIPQGMDIFEPFVTENSARSAGRGTGLGLAITKRIIERHGGSIVLDRKMPGYTKAFVVRLKCK